MLAHRTARLFLVALLVCATAFPARAQEEAEPPADVLHTETKKAEERIKAWDRENAKQDKKNYWEVPLASALIITGAAFATRNNTYAYATSFLVATGLIVHFWTGRHEAPPEDREPPTEP